MTHVINLFGGPGSGKSTSAAGIYHAMKNHGMKVELVREYVKAMAWEGRKIGPYDQFYILAKQMREETRLYGKVDYIITDSPIWLPVYYGIKYSPQLHLASFVKSFHEETRRQGIEHTNFLLRRVKAYDPDGRYETEEQARLIDQEQAVFMKDMELDYINADGTDLVNVTTQSPTHFERFRKGDL